MKPIQRLLVRLFIRTPPGDRRNWEAIRSWAAGIGKEMSLPQVRWRTVGWAIPVEGCKRRQREKDRKRSERMQNNTPAAPIRAAGAGCHY